MDDGPNMYYLPVLYGAEVDAKQPNEYPSELLEVFNWLGQEYGEDHGTSEELEDLVTLMAHCYSDCLDAGYSIEDASAETRRLMIRYLNTHGS